SNAKVYIHKGNGNGTLQAGVPYAVGPSPYALAAADFNADGSLDLAAAITGLPGALFTFRGNGNGTFQAGVEVRRITPMTSVLADDFNGDGSVDLAFATSQHPGAGAALLVGNGDG